MTERDAEGPEADRPPEWQREAAREKLESVIDAAAPGASVAFRSTDFGPGGGALGFSYRNGSLTVEYKTAVNAADGHPDTTAATNELAELNDHTPLSRAGEEYAAVERSAIEAVADTVADIPGKEALEPVTVWPVTNEPGLYRVGYEIRDKEFLYAVAFKIPATALN